jgi:O-methyltransferase
MPRAKKVSTIKSTIKKIFNIFNLEITSKNNFESRFNNYIAEISKEEKEILKTISEYALSSQVNQWSIIQSLKYIKYKDLDGSIVECGIFKGGTLLLIIKILENLGLKKALYGYDTFEKGFDKLSEHDVDIKGNVVGELKFEDNFFPTKDEVVNIFRKFGVNNEDMPILIKGKTQDTLQKSENIPEKISFLRLDTDIYEPTIGQLEVLFPKLCSRGVLHIDDYGHCPGVRKAVDEYFKNANIWLHRVDYSCRILIKD